ncbi:MAG: GNAT family protein [Planctomycetota bacterium]
MSPPESDLSSLWAPPDPRAAECLTERLCIRAYVPEDAESLFEAIEADRQVLLPWLPWANSENQTVEACRETIERFIENTARRDVDDFPLAIIDRGSGCVLGGTGLHRLQFQTCQAEIGYWIRGDRQNQGFCTEAIRAHISWAFRPQEDGGWGLRRLKIMCAEPNVASAAIPTKLGLQLEVRQREARHVDGFGYVDTLGWGILAKDWDTATHALRARS